MIRRKDFSYREYERKGVTLWGVYIGRTIRYTVCRTEEEAKATADILNHDPYYFERADWKDFISKRTAQ